MAKCKYCGKDAGFFSSVHKECEVFAKQTKDYFSQVALHVFHHGGDEMAMRQALADAAEKACLSPEERHQAAIDAITLGVNEALEDGIVTANEEKNILMLTRLLSLSERQLQASEAWDRLVKSRVLADILEGKVPSRFTFSGLKALLQKGESVIWAFNNVLFHEARTRRHYVGGSTGVSVRVASGVYLRTSAFKGHPVDKTELVHVDTGDFIITNKHIFMEGAFGTVKMPIRKLASMTPYSDGVGLQLDTASAKLRIFQNLDGWFAYNVITNLNLL